MTENNNAPERLDLRSNDIAEEKRAALRAAFPEVFTEGGKIDFDRLKLALGDTIDSGKERYGMNWPGKAECFRTISGTERSDVAALPRGVNRLGYNREPDYRW
jgi:adenine-specific DNA-methyltransferase